MGFEEINSGGGSEGPLDIGGINFYYAEGETWGEAIDNHDENVGWYIWGDNVYYSGWALCYWGGERVCKDDDVDPNESYYFDE